MAKITNLIVTFFLLFVLENTNTINGEEPIGGVDFPGSSIRCYFGTGTGITSSVSCPRYSLGCIKRVSCKFLLKNWFWFRLRKYQNISKSILDLKNGFTEEYRACGDLERSDIDYQEGCDSFDVPFDQKVCYCKQDLCNGSSRSMMTISLIILTLILTIKNS